MCREHVLQLQQTDWSDYGVQFLVVSFEQPEFVRRYRDETQLPWPIVADPERRLYQQFQMQHASWSQIMNWRSLRGYLGLVFGKRRRVKLPTNHDYWQLGGDVVVDPRGIVQLHHRSRSPEDRPAIVRIKEMIRQGSTEHPARPGER
jgi:hypothetical protein